MKTAATGLAIAGGAALVGFGIAAVKSFAEAGDEVQKMALRTGFSTEALSELRFAAEQSGASLDAVEKGAKRMASTIFDANAGLAESIRAFDAMGLSAEMLQGMSPEAQFNTIAMALASVEDASTRAALAQDVFGRAGTELLPLFSKGQEGMAELREQAQKLGVVFSQDAADSAADFVDAQNEVKQALSGILFSVAKEVVPALARFGRWFIENKPRFIAFVEEVRERAAPFFNAFTRGIETIWPLFRSFFGFIIDNKPVLIAAIAGIGAAIVLSLGPVSLGVLAILGLITLIGYLRDNWQEVWGAVKDITKGAVNAIIGFINGLIRAWNALEFSFEGKEVLGQTIIPGFTVGTPDIPLIPKLARGARNFRGGLAMVGEQGPELVNLPRGSDVIPNGRGMAPVNINFYGDVYGTADFDRKVNQAVLTLRRRGGG